MDNEINNWDAIKEHCSLEVRNYDPEATEEERRYRERNDALLVHGRIGCIMCLTVLILHNGVQENWLNAIAMCCVVFPMILKLCKYLMYPYSPHHFRRLIARIQYHNAVYNKEIVGVSLSERVGTFVVQTEGAYGKIESTVIQCVKFAYSETLDHVVFDADKDTLFVPAIVRIKATEN